MIQPKKKWGWKKPKVEILYGDGALTPFEKKKPFSKMVASLDRIFSKYIRLRDSDRNGICRCITCNRPFHWKDGDAGHFLTREKMATRWNEQNVHAQCIQCNRFKAGNQHEHGQRIDRLYGKGTAERLKAIGGARGTKVHYYWIEEEIKKYKQKVKKIINVV